MRGEILHYDEGQGFGFISGADGNRYTFRREDLRRETVLGKGISVEFEPNGGQAKNVFSIRSQVGSVPSVGTSSSAQLNINAPAAQQYGRNASADYSPATGTSLWSYFRQGLTTNYANFRGRARRKEYWGFYLFWLISFIAIVVVSLVIDGIVGNMDSGSEAPIVTGLAVLAWFLGTTIPHIAITVRRQHDIGLSGWLFLLILIPYIGGMIIFVFTLIPTQMHENKWGPIPLGIKPPPVYVPNA